MSTWNTANIAGRCRAGLAGLALAVLSPSLAMAEFGPRTIVGTKYQQWSSTTSENKIDPGSCTGGTSCYVIFQPIPQQQPLIVQRVTCKADLSAGTLDEVMVGSRKRQIFPAKFTYLVPVATDSRSWIVNSTAMHLINSGERPYIGFFSSTGTDWFLACSISGQLQQP